MFIHECSCYEAEWEAIKFMILSILEHERNWGNICLYSDSKEVVQRLKKIKMRKAWYELDQSCMNCDLQENLYFIHMSREFNTEADGLAKAGLHKTQVIKGWF